MSGTLVERLAALKARGVIGGYQTRQPNHGLSGGLLPWVIMPRPFGPATTYYNEHDLTAAIAALETFGSLQLSGKR